MALVVRRAFTPKNLNFLRCFKGRSYHITTTAMKRDQAYLSNATHLRSFKRKKSLDQYLLKTDETSPLNTKVLRNSTFQRNRISVSCPNLSIRSPMSSPLMQLRSFSTTAVNTNIFEPAVPFRRVMGFSGKSSDKGHASVTKLCGITARSQSCCPCPSPCSSTACPAACLPPPCQTPPRCVQYMTGYYYYPYGWWFCGPYHNKACAPCGPCCPDQMRCGGCACAPSCCVVPSALAATTTLAGFDPSRIDPSGFNEMNQTGYDWSKVQNPMYPQTNPATPGPGLDPGFQPSFEPSRQPAYQPGLQPSFQPSHTAPKAPGPNVPMFKPSKGVSKFFSVNPALNVSPAGPSVKWPPLQQPPTCGGSKKQQGNSMSTLCHPVSVVYGDDSELQRSTSYSSSYPRDEIAPNYSWRLPRGEVDSREKTMNLVTAGISHDNAKSGLTSSQSATTPRKNKTKIAKKFSFISLLRGSSK